MELLNLIIAIASFVVSVIGSIYIPLHLHHKASQRDLISRQSDYHDRQ